MTTSIGQRFRNLRTGELIKVKCYDDARALVVNMDNGERRWVDRNEFPAVWKPVPMPIIKEA
jgi:hypothetical protein